MPRYVHVTDSTRVPVPGGKTIDELFGRVHNGEERFSLARMVAPGGWAEPPQRPEFGELTVMLRGTMEIEIDGAETVTLTAGEALWVEPGVGVRYRNPSAHESEYLAICLPAFSPELAHRED